MGWGIALWEEAQGKFLSENHSGLEKTSIRRRDWGGFAKG